MVVFGQKWLHSGKVVLLEKKLLYLVKSGCIREKVLVFGERVFFKGIDVVFGTLYSGQKRLYSGKSLCILATRLYSGKVVVFGQKRFYSGKSGCIRAKVVVFRQKGLYSGKVVVFGQNWFYSGKRFCTRAKSVVFAICCCARAKAVVFGQR